MSDDNLPRRDMTRDEARRRTDQFKVHTEAWLEELVALHDDQVWWALGYADWEEYCRAEFGSIRLPRGSARTEAVLTLRQASMSIRDISSALGLGVGTIHRAIGAGEQPAMIIGADGKYYPATSPTPEIEAGVPNGTPPSENVASTVAETLSDVDESEPSEHKHVHMCTDCGAILEDVAASYGVTIEEVHCHPEKFHGLGHAHPGGEQWRASKLEEMSTRLRRLKEARASGVQLKDFELVCPSGKHKDSYGYWLLDDDDEQWLDRKLAEHETSGGTITIPATSEEAIERVKAVAEDIERLDRIQAQLAAEHELREWQRKHQHLADYRDVIARVLGEDE